MLSLIAMAIVVGWSMSQASRMQTRIAWAEARRENPTAVLERDEPAPTADGNLLLANERGRILFPPDHQGAIESTRRALLLDPLESSAWMILAREKLLQNHMDEARAALSRSDELEPRYPGQRVEAIRLWSLLDEPNRAMELARQISLLGDEYAAAAAAELIATGREPSSVFKILRLDELPPDEKLMAARAMAAANPGAMAPVLATFTNAELADHDFGNQFVELLYSPMNIKEIERVWALHSTRLIEEQGLLLADPNLTYPPFEHSFHLGWQQPMQSTTVISRWQPAESEIRDTGAHIEMQFTRSAKEQIRWIFYRLPIPPDWSGTIELRVRISPAASATCRLGTGRGGQARYSAPSDTTEEGWQWLRLPITATKSGRVADLIFERNFRGGRSIDLDDMRVSIDELRVSRGTDEEGTP
ncbi:hypothetical protein KQI84_00790 [bacterium]|nr:hypothetical protein [bacterium]